MSIFDPSDLFSLNRIKRLGKKPRAFGGNQNLGPPGANLFNALGFGNPASFGKPMAVSLDMSNVADYVYFQVGYATLVTMIEETQWPAVSKIDQPLPISGYGSELELPETDIDSATMSAGFTAGVPITNRTSTKFVNTGGDVLGPFWVPPGNVLLAVRISPNVDLTINYMVFESE